MFRFVVSLFAIALFSGGLRVLPQESNQQAFRVSADLAFSQPRAVLSQLVGRKGNVRRNNFCVIGYQFSDGNKSAWVYWREGKAIILWEPTAEGIADLTQTRRYLRLPQDIVADGTDPQGSTYRVTRQWVNSLISDCQTRGEKFVVTKRNHGRKAPSPRNKK